MTTTATSSEDTEHMDRDVYIDAIAVADMFVDHLYQRDLDENRAHRMSAAWDRRLAGVLDVSDRGAGTHPRYAIINGQHRWAAVMLTGAVTHLPANVHTGLTPADEAALFRDLDITTKKLTTWDRWKARRAAGDHTVNGIEDLAAQFGLKIYQCRGYYLMCFSTLEYCYDIDPEYLARTLELVTDIWPSDPQSLKSSIIRGLFAVLQSQELDTGRLADALSDMTPGQLHARAIDASKTRPGSFWTHVVRATVDAYNRRGRGKVDAAAVIGSGR
ncbi:DUF6551 family protein [Mycobacteroides chelonae]|uniref:DUF6551 family protein n=1 Tax=Mycobacteroides chelonae TaxID=1774 RepID=UPI0010421111|nr:DUF6551 family protein [Mycobacteroides chelonae]